MIATRLKVRACKHCKERFMQERPGQQVHLECISGYVETLRAKRLNGEKKVHRAALKTIRETIPTLIKDAQHAFNAYIRERDQNKPCVCCGRPLGASDVGGSFDCGHYRSTGSASHLRFDERNAHGQRKDCNRWGAGRAVDYRIGLVARIGLEAVESLECSNQPRKWTKEELRAIRATYVAKLKELRE